MDSYDNDTILLLLDDDLFPVEEEENVDTVQSESSEDQGR